jgi:Skp family chaperone for outer membrane proteins
MKTLLRWGCVVAAVAVVVVVGRLGAEDKAKKSAPRTRIGTVNLSYVIKKYDKYLHFQEEIKSIMEPLQKREAKLRARLEKIRPQYAGGAIQNGRPVPPMPPSPSGITLPDYLEKPGSTKKSVKKPAKTDEESEEEEEDKPKDAAAEALQIQRQLEDLKAEATRKLSNRGDEAIRAIYIDVQAIVNRYAETHGLDLVMHYNDAISKEEYLSPQNIARKLSTGALMPMYEGKGIDISEDITEALNKKYSKE